MPATFSSSLMEAVSSSSAMRVFSAASRSSCTVAGFASVRLRRSRSAWAAVVYASCLSRTSWIALPMSVVGAGASSLELFSAASVFGASLRAGATEAASRRSADSGVATEAAS